MRERGKVPIAVGENLHTCGAFRDFVVSGAVDFLQPDVARAGGISEIMKITAMAAKHEVPVSFHTWGDGVALAASVHLAAALQDCIVMELDYTYNPLREELLREPINVHGGFLTPPEKPGLGVELNAEALQRFAFAGSRSLRSGRKLSVRLSPGEFIEKARGMSERRKEDIAQVPGHCEILASSRSISSNGLQNLPLQRETFYFLFYSM